MPDLITRLLLNSNQFDNNIRSSGKELQKFQEMGKNVTLAIGKFAGAIGLAMGANEAFNRTINSTQTTGDAWVKMNDQMTASVDSFFTSLAMGDFSGFLNNLQNVINKAGDLADLMDELATKSLFTNSELSGLNMQRQIYLNISKDRSKSDAERKKALLEAENIQKRITALQKSEAGTNRQAANATVRAALAKQGFKGEVADESVNYLLKESNRTKVTAGANDYKAKKKSIDYAMNVDAESGLQTHSKESRRLQAEFDKYMNSQRGKQNELFYYFSQMDDSEKSMLASAIALNNKANDMYTSISNAELEQNLSGAKINGSWKNQNKAGATALENANKEVVNKGSLDEVNKQLADARKKYDAAATDELRRQYFNLIQELEAKQIHLNFIAQFGNKEMPDIKQAGLGDKLNESGKTKSLPKIQPVVNKKEIKLTNEYADSLQSLGSMLSAITNLTNDGAAAWLSWGATLLGTVATAIPAIAALTTAKQTEATANAQAATTGAASAVAAIPLVGPIMAVAAIASIIAAFASIPKFETGGIIGGSSYTGDKLLARVNSGEMILNKAQQNNLYNALYGVKSPNINMQPTEVVLKVKGKDLEGVLKNYSSKISKVK